MNNETIKIEITEKEFMEIEECIRNRISNNYELILQLMDEKPDKYYNTIQFYKHYTESLKILLDKLMKNE